MAFTQAENQHVTQDVMSPASSVQSSSNYGLFNKFRNKQPPSHEDLRPTNQDIMYQNYRSLQDQ